MVRYGGTHAGAPSSFIILDDDTIMAFGGKQVEIDGFHPLNISTITARPTKW